MRLAILHIILLGSLLSVRAQDPWQGVSYYVNSDKPYGLSLWRELVYDQASSFDEVDEGLTDFLEDREGETYIVVSSFLNYSDKDADALVDFIENGNTAYIATNNLTGELFKRLTDTLISNIQVFEANSPKSRLDFQVDEKQYAVNFKYNQKVYKHRWTSLNIEHFKHPVKVLATTHRSDPLLVELSLGKGKLYVCSAPYVFLNVALAEKDGLKRLEALLPMDNLKKVVFDQKIILFHHNNTPSYLEEHNVNRTVYIPPKPKQAQGSGGGSGVQSSPEGPKSSFSYIFAQRHLRTAYLILLALGLLYVLNSARRKYRIVPLYKRSKTSEIEHMRLLSNFYYKSGSDASIFKHLDVSFRMIIRNRLQINLNVENPESWERLKAKFTGNPAIIDHLYKLQVNLLRKKDVSRSDIIEYNRTIEQILAKLN